MWENAKGKVIYIPELQESTQIHLAKTAPEPFVLIVFGDASWWTREDIGADATLLPKNIEQMSVMFRDVLQAGVLDANFLVTDAYLMQARSPSPTKKGAAIKGFLSTFISDFQELNLTMIFTSETTDHTLIRQFKNFPQI